MSISSLLLGLGFLASELLLARFRRSTRIPGTDERDDGSLRMLWRVIGLAIAGGVVLAVYGIGSKLPGHFPWHVAGMIVFVVGTAVRWWSIRHLGRFFTVDVAVASDHRLIDTGPYHWVRHPSYTGLLLQFLGMALAFGNAWSLLVIIVPVFLALSRRIQVEERALTAKFGAGYADYATRTKRLVPLVY